MNSFISPRNMVMQNNPLAPVLVIDLRLTTSYDNAEEMGNKAIIQSF